MAECGRPWWPITLWLTEGIVVLVVPRHGGATLPDWLDDLLRNRLALSPKKANNERTPPTLARDLGRGLATCALQEAHMTAFYPSRPQRLRHPIPPYPGARPLPGAPS